MVTGRPRLNVRRYSQATGQIARDASRDLAAFWEALDFEDMDEVLEALDEFLPDLVSVYGGLNAQAACDWYETIRSRAPLAKKYRDFTASPSPAIGAEFVRERIRSALSPVLEGKQTPEQGLKALNASTVRWVKQAKHDTIASNSVRDKARTRFARVPRGPVTCNFCLMLASRGFVYATAEAAGALTKFHDRCDCEIVPAFGDQTPRIKGYDPDALYEQYQARQAGEDGHKPEQVESIGGRVPVGAWPGGVPRARGGVRPAATLNGVPRMFVGLSYEDQVTKVNPHYERAGQWPEVFGPVPYRNNCVRCAATLELRARGYDLEAGAGMYRPLSDLQNSWDMVQRWVDREGNPVQFGSRLTTRGKPSNKLTLNWVLRQPEGARGVMACTWMKDGRRNGGHIWNWRIKNGQLEFWDGQAGRKVELKEYLSIAYPGTIRVARLDEALPTDALLEVVSIPEPRRKP